MSVRGLPTAERSFERPPRHRLPRGHACRDDPQRNRHQRAGNWRRLPRSGGRPGRPKALNASQVQTPGTITFVGTVGEEGLGDLRGVKHLFDRELKGRIDRFISVDGGGHGMTYAAVGSRRCRVAFKGPGGHSYGAFGATNPIPRSAARLPASRSFRCPLTRKPRSTSGASAEARR